MQCKGFLPLIDAKLRMISFLFCRMIMNEIRSAANIAQVKKIMAMLPRKLNEMYSKTLDRLQEQARNQKPRAVLALQALTWIVFSARPLHIAELQHALACDSSLTEIDHEAITPSKIIESASLGLFRVDENCRCRLIHLTASQFLRDYFDAAQSNRAIAQTCLHYLSIRDVTGDPCRDGSSLTQKVERYILAPYAARHLGEHVKDCEVELADGLWSLLKKDGADASLCQLFYFQDRKDTSLQAGRFDSLPKGQSALHFACATGLLCTSQRLLRDGANPAKLDDQGWSPAHVAESNGQTKVIMLLLNEGASVEQPDRFGWTPLFWAAFKGHHDTVEALLNHGASVLTRDESDWTALHWAAYKGDSAMLKTLKSSPRAGEDAFWQEIDTMKNYRDEKTKDRQQAIRQRFEPVFLAVEQGNTEAINTLIEAVSGIQLPPLKIHVIASDGNDHYDGRRDKLFEVLTKVEYIRYFRGAEGDHNSIAFPESFLLQLLDSAVRSDHLDMVTMVLEHDVDLTSQAYREIKGRSILHTAAFCNDARIPAALLQSGANFLETDEDDYYPLDLAIGNANDAVIKVFLSHSEAKTLLQQSNAILHLVWSNKRLFYGAADNTDNHIGSSTKHNPSDATLEPFGGRVGLAKSLIELGAPTDLRSTQGLTPYHYAVSCGEAAVNLLVIAGADIHMRDNRSSTPFHTAVRPPYFGELSTDCDVIISGIARLQELGVDIDSQDDQERSAFHYAIKDSKTQLVP